MNNNDYHEGKCTAKANASYFCGFFRYGGLIMHMGLEICNREIVLKDVKIQKLDVKLRKKRRYE